jgi:hypothetical protein
MTACANCSRALQPAWKFCIFCGTPVVAAASAPRSRPLPKRTPVPGYASANTAQTAAAQTATAQTATAKTPIVPPPAPAPLSAAPVEQPVSSVWPESLGERPTLRSALAGTDVPAPTPPVEDAPPPVEDEPVAPVDEPIDEAPGPEPEPVARVTRRSRSRGATSTAVLENPVEVEPLDDEYDDEDEDEPADRSGSVNTLAVLALLIGVLACPLAAPFGHLALGQVKASGERGLIPAWIAVVLGYLWLGFWIVFVITYFATNG